MRDWTDEVHFFGHIKHLGTTRVAIWRFVHSRSLCVSAPTRRRSQPQHACQVHGGFDELTSRTRQGGCQTRACDQFVARPYRCTVGRSPASVCTGILAARTGCESSFVPVGPYGFQRARNVAPERLLVQGRQPCITRPLQSRRNRSPTSWNNCGMSASEPSIGDWLEDTRETL